MHDQRDVTDKGGTMRLGAYYAVLEPGTQGRRRPTASRSSASATATATSSTRTTGPASRRPVSCCSGTSPDRRLVEFIELGRPPVLGRHPGPSRVQEPARPAAPAVPRADRRDAPARRDPPGLRRMLDEAATETPAAEPGVERRRVLTDGGLSSPRRNRGAPRPHLARGRRRLRGARRHTFVRDVVRSPGAVAVVPVTFDAVGAGRW